MLKKKKPFKKGISAKSAVKKAVRKIPLQNKRKEERPIGKITHYFSNISVAVINLAAPVKIGDAIRVLGGKETDFEQKVSSMQIDRKEIKSAKKGDSVGIKIDQKVHEGYKVYKV